MDKKYNGNVSAYLDPANRAFETVVYQANKPLLDCEQNLLQDIALETGLYDVLRSIVPSGFIHGDFLNGLEDFVFDSTANQFKLVNRPVALVNGFKVLVEYTDSVNDGENVVSLSIPPASGIRTDFVFLEVWRALLDTTGTNKSAGKIWRKW